MTTPPDTLMFKAFVHEVQETVNHYGALNLLSLMCTPSASMTMTCEKYIFAHDGEISEDEAYLVEWLKKMEQQDEDEVRKKLLPVAHKMERNSR